MSSLNPQMQALINPRTSKCDFVAKISQNVMLSPIWAYNFPLPHKAT